MEVHQIHQVRAIFHYESLPPPCYCLLLPPLQGIMGGGGEGVVPPQRVGYHCKYEYVLFKLILMCFYFCDWHPDAIYTFKISLTKRKEWDDKLLIFLTSTRPKWRLCKLETLQNVAFAKCRLCKLSPCIQLNVISRHIVYITWSQYTLTSSCYYHNTVLALAKKSKFCSDFSRIFLITVVNVLLLLVRISF